LILSSTIINVSIRIFRRRFVSISMFLKNKNQEYICPCLKFTANGSY
jgi:hypothetical protein